MFLFLARISLQSVHLFQEEKTKWKNLSCFQNMISGNIYMYYYSL